VHVCVHVYVVCVCALACVRVDISRCAYICVHMIARLCMCMHVCVQVHACVHLCVDVCASTPEWVSTHQDYWLLGRRAVPEG